ncbi:hypothetical protein, partial [Streptomyces sp. NPDC055185]
MPKRPSLAPPGPRHRYGTARSTTLHAVLVTMYSAAACGTTAAGDHLPVAAELTPGPQPPNNRSSSQPGISGSGAPDQ